MSTLRVFIADDEPLVRTGLRKLLAEESDIEVVGEATHGADAARMIVELRPDLVFLDVQMPELDGFAVLAFVREEDVRPAVVFVTAYDEYAIKAFDEHAVDYLLKPFNDARFRSALERARSRIGREEPASTDPLDALAGAARPAEGAIARRLLVKDNGRVIVVQTEDIDWIEAADNYVRVHTSSGRYLLRESMKSIEKRLDPGRFARAHRSVIVNLSRVREMEPLFGGEYRILLTTGAALTLSRGYRDSFRNQLLSEQ